MKARHSTVQGSWRGVSFGERTTRSPLHMGELALNDRLKRTPVPGKVPLTEGRMFITSCRGAGSWVWGQCCSEVFRNAKGCAGGPGRQNTGVLGTEALSPHPFPLVRDWCRPRQECGGERVTHVGTQTTFSCASHVTSFPLHAGPACSAGLSAAPRDDESPQSESHLSIELQLPLKKKSDGGAGAPGWLSRLSV